MLTPTQVLFPIFGQIVALLIVLYIYKKINSGRIKKLCISYLLSEFIMFLLAISLSYYINLMGCGKSPKLTILQVIYFNQINILVECDHRRN